MHWFGRVRKRFLEIFFIENVTAPEAGIAPGTSAPENKAGPVPLRGQIAFFSLSLLLAAGCAGPTTGLFPPQAGEKPRSVYVIHHGALHTGVAVKRSDIPPGVWPAHRDFRRSQHLEIGWGDDDGYRKPLTPAIALKALAGSHRTVLLAEGFDLVREKVNSPRFTVIQVDLSDRGFARLCRHIEQTYALDESGRPIHLGKGWYRAQGTYSAFHTCNTWVAEGLRKAGCPITPAYCVTSGALLAEVRQFGRVLR